MTIVNDDSRVVNKLEASLTDDARVVIYDHLMFISRSPQNEENVEFGEISIFNDQAEFHLCAEGRK